MSTQNPDQIFYYSLTETLMGWVGIAGNERGLRRLILPERTKEDALAELDRYFKSSIKLIPTDEQFFPIIKKIKEYFAGKGTRFKEEEINLDDYTVFQKNVLLKTREIPFGVTRTYRWIAEQAGYPRAYRAVGGVMSINPIPLIIPCHRVLGSCGELTGFSATGGLALKRSMLKLEGISTRE
ncbi:MAG: methylated-DNA--[protein]-cysteine S-methyltransferase [Atribacterota bacterium]